METKVIQMKKTWFFPLLTCSLLWLTGCQNGQDAAATAAVDTGPIEALVEDSGTVVNRDPYAIYPTVSGKITSCTFEEGDAVQKGDVLYTIDSTALEDQIAQAELSLKSAQQSLTQAEAACGDLSVRAKASGTVTALHVHVGDFVAAGTPVAELTDREQLLLTVPFSTADAAAIRPGASAAITFVSYSGEVSGTVTRVYDAPSALSGGREGVYVEIRFRNPGALSGSETAMAQIGTAACMEAGQVKAGTAQSIYAAQSGQVLTLSVDTGSAVQAGDTVLTLDNAAVTNARDNARLAVESASVSLSQLKAKRSDYTLTAPADGMITVRQAKAGDFASAAAPLATLAQENALGVEAAVDEIYIEKIFAGQAASVTFTDDSGAERTYPAAVRRTAEEGIASGGVTDYTVELNLENTEGLRAGMNVSVSIVTARKEQCLRVPSAAVHNGTVQVQRSGKPETVPVTTGLSGGGYTEILDGLSEGDTVLLS